MELLIPSQVIGTFVALFFVYYFLCRSRHTKGGREAPTPSGALPVIGHLHLLGGQNSLARTLGAMADKYGPAIMIRLGIHPSLIVSSGELIKECFTTNDRVLASRPIFAAGKYLGYHYAVFGLSPHGSYWREIRKLSTVELLSKSRLEKLRHVRFYNPSKNCIHFGPKTIVGDL
ncbi:xanthotoxin 5-hydroxylase CYP82C4-like [Macadamia integrifolia]|uniref:xanthotoxin 5-hydroxylase CYP82C4-like n=1 Tax=Macadamia integrifolia TaxID=60698 RepID=UPI001C4E3BC0|nr:xanthotoxin 5-hydroxylase CYP82C4-like [Macadamia integrifolia]